jgi:hypothetical protein
MFYWVEFGKMVLYELAVLGSAWFVFNIDYKQIVSNMDPRLIGMRALYQYSKVRTQWQKYWSDSYKNNCITRYTIDTLNYAVRYADSKWRKVRLEPFSDQWMSTCILTQDPAQLRVTVQDEGDHRVFFGSAFHETFYSNGDWPKERAQESFELECTVQSAFSKVGDLEILMLMKSGKYYLSRIGWLVGDKQKETTVVSWAPSTMWFLSIEYRHPAMERSIGLTIDRGCYLEGNHLLSAAFVRRSLEYQYDPKDYYFDMNYTVTVMDNEINMFQLKSNQYVIVEKDGYKVV